VDLEIAEPPGEDDVLDGGERLVAEEDHLGVQQGPADLGDRLVGKVGGQVDAGQLGARGRAERPNVEMLPREGRESLPLGLEVTERADLHRRVVGQ